ncbi:MAG TPA: serine/threonine-protein kinase [Kofleriaceae bacterium]|nr:serine/threonine-protein kinase [Kofleriaceae bacterium]
MCGAALSGAQSGGIERTASIAALSPAPSSPRTETSDMRSGEKDFSAILSRGDEPPRAQTENPAQRIGQVLGSFKLVEVVGRGGMGCVYRAQHTKLGRDVALKLLREDYAERRDAVARFFQEAKAVNLIRHKNIVDIIDYVELEDGTVFIIMEFLAGHSLGRLMRAPGALSFARGLLILSQICDGLAAAHDVGIVHRDLKPDNIFVVKSAEGNDLVKILDFGVAKLIDKGPGGEDLTAAGSVIGTPAYMSPEQAGGLAVDARCDVYSLGAIMYEIFTRRTPFRAKTFGEYVRMHLSEIPVRPRLMPGGQDIDPRIDAIIMRCLDKSPSARYQSARDLKGDLIAILGTIDTGAAALAAASGTWQAPVMAQGGNSLKTPPGLAAAVAAAVAAQPEPNATVSLRAQSQPGVGMQPTVHDTPWRGSTPYPATPHPNSAVDSMAYGTPGPYQMHQTPDPMAMESRQQVLSRRRVNPQTLAVAVAGVSAAVVLALVVPWMMRRADDEAIASPSVSAAPDPAIAGDEPAGTAVHVLSPGGEAPEARVEPEAGDKPEAPAEVDPVDPKKTPETKPGPKTAAARATGRVEKRVEKAPSIVVRIMSTPPGAKLTPSGKKGVVCETPCSVTINPGDGGSTSKRTYVLRRDGYVDDTVTIELDKPPKQLEVDLKRVPKPEPEPKKKDPEPKKKDPEPKKKDPKGDTTFNPFGTPKK